MSTCVIPGYVNATPDDQAKALVQCFQRVFSSDDGKIVLNALLTDWAFFELSTSEREMQLTEYAKYFLRERLGITNTFELSNAILKTMNDRKDHV